MESSIDIIDVAKHFYVGDTVVKALSDITLSLPEKGFWALMGPSGSGKSTLFKICGGIEHPSSGYVYWNNTNINYLKSKEIANLRNNLIGFVFQNFNLVSIFNVFENVELPLIINGMVKERRKKRVIEIIKEVGIYDKLYHNINKLSGGQQQRVAIARALVNDPKVILADEPTGNLDSKTGKKIIDLLFTESIKNSAFLIIVTHDRRVAEQSEKILYINDGKLEKNKKYITVKNA